MEANAQPSANNGTDKAETRSFRQRLGQVPGVLLGAVAVFALGVYDNLKGSVVSSTADWVRYRWSTPVYHLELSDAVPIAESGITLRSLREPERSIRPERVFLTSRLAGSDLVRFIAITVYPGSYFVTLERSAPDGPLVLNEQLVSLVKPDDVAKINTAASQWSSRAALTTLPLGPGTEPGRASGTRWSIAPSDGEALAAAEGRSAAILRAALGQLGVWEKGGEADRRAIDAYWQSARAAGGVGPSSSSDPIWGLWGGAFLAWTVAQGGGSPPASAAAFRSWQGWGTSIEPSAARPGMIVIVETGQRQSPTPSGLMVGIYLRHRADCVEIVTGNMADRVAVTCVRGKVLGFRSAG